MKEVKFCPFCHKGLKKLSFLSYRCYDCKAIIYISVECSVDSPILEKEESIYSEVES